VQDNEPGAEVVIADTAIINLLAEVGAELFFITLGTTVHYPRQILHEFYQQPYPTTSA
jgi:hypothetical protein